MKIKNLPRPIRNFIYKFMWFRQAIIYAYSCVDPNTNKRIPWAYIGQTRQNLVDRHNQHMGNDSRQPRQPWSDLYPEIRIIWQGKGPDLLVDLIEEFYIKVKRPLYNYIHNTKNPSRIPKYEAEKLRKQRDLQRKRLRARV